MMCVVLLKHVHELCMDNGNGLLLSVFSLSVVFFALFNLKTSSLSFIVS